MRTRDPNRIQAPTFAYAHGLSISQPEKGATRNGIALPTIVGGFNLVYVAVISVVTAYLAFDGLYAVASGMAACAVPPALNAMALGRWPKHVWTSALAVPPNLCWIFFLYFSTEKDWPVWEALSAPQICALLIEVVTLTTWARESRFGSGARQKRSTRALHVAAGLAAGAAIAACLPSACTYWRTHSGFYMPARCEASAEARVAISKKLTAEQALTLKPVATLTDEDASCSLTFTYMKDGKIVEASALVDAIHGLKLYGHWDPD